MRYTIIVLSVLVTLGCSRKHTESIERARLPFHTVPSVTVETKNEQAFFQKVRSIDQATRSIDMAYFIYSDDFTSSYLSRKLIQRARSGVKVRILLDAAMATPFHNFFKMLVQKGSGNLQVAYFRPVSAQVFADITSWGFSDPVAFLTAATSVDVARLKELFAQNHFLNDRVNPTNALTRLVSTLIPRERSLGNLLPILREFQRGNHLSIDDILHLAGRELQGSGARATFHPSAWVDATKRLHHKLLVIDGKTLQGGGRNIEDSYHWGVRHRLRDPAKNRYVFMDTDFVVESAELAAASLVTFNEFWKCTVEHPCKANIRVALETAADASLSAETESAWTEMNARADRYAETLTNPSDTFPGLTAKTAKGSVQYFENRMFPDPAAHSQILSEEKSEYHETWIRLMDATPADQEVILHNAYFFLPSGLLMATVRAIERGVRLTIVTNSPLSSDLGFIAQLARFQYGELIRVGKRLGNAVRLFEYNTIESLHTKVGVFGDTLIVGSANADPRSEQLDTNNGIVIGPDPTSDSRTPSLASHYRKWFEELRTQFLTESRRLENGNVVSLLSEITESSLAIERADWLRSISRLPAIQRDENRLAFDALQTIIHLSFQKNAEGDRARRFLQSLFLQL